MGNVSGLAVEGDKVRGQIKGQRTMEARSLEGKVKLKGSLRQG